jgi:hypothetical protein
MLRRTASLDADIFKVFLKECDVAWFSVQSLRLCVSAFNAVCDAGPATPSASASEH